MSERFQPDDPHALLQALMRHDFRAFLRKAYATVRGGEALLWNWHLDAIAHQLDRVTSGESRRLLVNMPPRNLKSIMISIAWVAWMLGRDPTLNFVCVSYASDKLSAKLARNCLALMQSGWYRELFPGTLISSLRSAADDFETTRGGGRLATSVTGTLTGRGGDIIIIDDPIKPEEAHSETTRNSVNNWFQSTLASRLNDKATGSIVVVMQRLHENDLSGMLMETGEWDKLSLSAIATEEALIPLPRGRNYLRRVNEVLHAQRESREVLERQRSLMGSIAFEAQYQQNPVPAEGNLVKAEWLQTYAAEFEPGRPGQIVQSWDMATKDGANNDYSVCITAHVWRGVVRILDVYRAKIEFPDLKRAAIRLAREYNAESILIEDQASGSQLIQVLRSEHFGIPWPVAITPESDKYSRMAGASGQIEAGRLQLPTDAAWLASFKSEILGFPNARHDDQADALSQLVNWVTRNLSSLEPEIIAGPILVTVEDHATFSSENPGTPMASYSDGTDYWSAF